MGFVKIVRIFKKLDSILWMKKLQAILVGLQYCSSLLTLFHSFQPFCCAESRTVCACMSPFCALGWSSFPGVCCCPCMDAQAAPVASSQSCLDVSAVHSLPWRSIGECAWQDVGLQPDTKAAWQNAPGIQARGRYLEKVTDKNSINLVCIIVDVWLKLLQEGELPFPWTWGPYAAK